MASKLNPEKKVDLPPKGSRNADPITNAPGSHPNEAGVGAAYGGAAECRYGGDRFKEIEGDLEHDWNSRTDQQPSMTWSHARDAVRDGYDRTVQIRRARDVPEVTDDVLED